MAKPAVARETLCALRETIARIEGQPLAALAREGDDPTRAGFRPRQGRQSARPAGNDKGTGTEPGAIRSAGKTHLTNAPAARPHDPDAAITAAEAAGFLPGIDRLPFGSTALDRATAGGLPLAALSEIRAEETRDAGAAAGFALALGACLQRRHGEAGAFGRPPAVLWIGEPLALSEAGEPYAPGLLGHGIDPERFFLVRPRSLEEALWAADLAAAVPSLGAVIVEIRGNPARLGLAESRRLHLRARGAGRPVLLLRQAGHAEAVAAPLRFLVRSAPARGRLMPDGSRLPASLDGSAYAVTLEKGHLPGPLTVCLEWNPHECRFSERGRAADAGSLNTDTRRNAQPAHPFPGAAAPADRPDRAEPLGRVLAFDGQPDGQWRRVS